MVSALVSGLSGPLVSTLAEDIVLCSWARHVTLLVSLSTQVYNELLGVSPAIDWHPYRGNRNTPS